MRRCGRRWGWMGRVRHDLSQGFVISAEQANKTMKRAEGEVKAERVRWFLPDFRKALIESLPEPEMVAESNNVTPAT